MIDLKDLGRWQALGEGASIRFEADKMRRFRLEVNTPNRTRFYLVNGTDVTFLASVDGYEVIQFIAPEVFEITSDGAEALIYTTEFEQTSVEIPDAVIFTKIAERRARNPELEYMMSKVQENMDRRLAVATRDFEQRTAALAAQIKANANVDTGTPVSGSAPVRSESDAGAGESGADDIADDPTAA